LVIDMEHTAIDFAQCLNLIQIIESNGVAPLVRVGTNDPLLIKRAMDAGAHGIIVPMINTAEDAQKAIEAIYYPPIGNRGVGLGRAQNYGVGFEEYKEWAKTEIVFIPQIEHIDGVNNLESVLALEEVDGFIVGPYDLSGSLNVPGEWEHPDVINALNKVKNVVSDHIKSSGFHVVHSNHNKLEQCIADGYTFIAYGDDMVFFAETIAIKTDFISGLKELNVKT
jgi:2-keto-3-deoxy-L-rhamnonate aldolase RhmA